MMTFLEFVAEARQPVKPSDPVLLQLQRTLRSYESIYAYHKRQAAANKIFVDLYRDKLKKRTIENQITRDQQKLRDVDLNRKRNRKRPS